MKNFILFSAILFSAGFTKGQVSHQSLISEGQYSEHANAITFDEDGNLYFTGAFQGNISFGNQSFSALGDTDILIGKCSSEGAPIWASQSGSKHMRKNSISEYGSAIAVNEDYLYVAGVFRGLASFSEQVQLKSNGSHDIFLAQFTKGGQLNWIRSFGGDSQDLVEDMAIDDQGNVYLTGAIQHLVTFNKTTSIEAQHGREAFIVKYSKEGQFEWVRQSSSPFNTHGRGLKINNTQVIIAGDFVEHAQFGEKSLVSDGKSDGFLWSVSLEGDSDWSVHLGSDGMDKVSDVVVHDGHIFVSGQFSEAQNAGWTSNGKQDVFLQQYDLQGRLQWSRTLGGNGYDVARKLTIDDRGHIILTGNFEDQIVVDGHLSLSNGNSDIFITEFNANGNIHKFETIGGSGQDKAKDATFREGNLYLAGNYWGEWSKHVSAGRADAFIASVVFEEPEKPSEIKDYVIYPNPATEGTVTVSSENVFDQIKIINNSGKTIYETHDIASKNFDLDIMQYKSGIYFIQIDEKVIKKLIIEKGN